MTPSIEPHPSEPVIVPKKRGRKLGGKNKPGHKAGRPRKPAEVFAPSIWESGRAGIAVRQQHLDAALRANSSHCAIAMAIKDAVPDAKHIAVDLQTIRWTNPKRGVRYCFLTPAVAQHSVIIPFDQGETCKPVTFRMKPAFVVRMGAKRRHTPDPERLRGTGLRVAEEQAHLPNSEPKPESSPESEPTPASSPDKAKVPYVGKEPRKPRVPRAKISETPPDGSVPVTLGGKLPPVSVRARREFGLRALRR
jgi:hypothetical protein